MTTLSAPTTIAAPDAREHFALEKPDHVWRRLLTNGRFLVGGAMLLVILGSCIVSLPWTGNPSAGVDEDGYQIDNPFYFDTQDPSHAERSPSREAIPYWFGTDKLGRS